MAKQVKRVYRILAWFFSVVVAAGTLMGCRKPKGEEPPADLYGPPAYNSTRSSSKTPINSEQKKVLTESERSQGV